MMYVQCEMKRENSVDVTWIEEKFAKVGNMVKRKNDQDNWEDGWVVTATYHKTSEQHVKKLRELYKNHRKGTDI